MMEESRKSYRPMGSAERGDQPRKKRHASGGTMEPPAYHKNEKEEFGWNVHHMSMLSSVHRIIDGVSTPFEVFMARTATARLLSQCNNAWEDRVLLGPRRG